MTMSSGMKKKYTNIYFLSNSITMVRIKGGETNITFSFSKLPF